MNPSAESQQIASVLDTLKRVYGNPDWRGPLQPVDELVSTMLSQNTNDINRDKAFNLLKQKFPSWEQVRLAPVEEIVECIRVAGLANQKGPRIKEALNRIHDETGGLDLIFLAEMSVEDARTWLLRFKGVGRKTAAIVLQFALNKPAFPVDTHIYRVTGRLGVRPANFNLEQTHDLMEELVDPMEFYAGHLNLIRLGREVCHARKPSCPSCPVKQLCHYPDKTP
jgi:endonuclease III